MIKIKCMCVKHICATFWTLMILLSVIFYVFYKIKVNIEGWDKKVWTQQINSYRLNHTLSVSQHVKK